MKKTKSKLSIVVATHNRPYLLSKCIESLLSQERKRVEIIVVDSSDHKNNKTYTKNIKYFYVNKKGLSGSRNTGFNRAMGEFVAFIDDDAIAGSSWIKEILSFIKRHPNVQAFGGGYSRYSLKPLPEWFPPSYGINNLGNKERVLKIGREWLSGTNMIFKKELLIKLGGFDENLGMKGESIGYGEETDLQSRIYKTGGKIYYSPKLKVNHLVATKKISLKWLLVNRFKLGLTSSKAKNLDRNAPSHLYGLVVGFVDILKWMTKPERIPIKRRTYYALGRLSGELGALYSLIKGTK